MRRALLVVVALVVVVRLSARADSPECEDPNPPLECQIPDPTLPCYGTAWVEPAFGIAPTSGWAPYYVETEGGFWFGIIVADAGSGTLPIGGHQRFQFFGAIADVPYCKNPDPAPDGDVAGYWEDRVCEPLRLIGGPDGPQFPCPPA